MTKNKRPRRPTGSRILLELDLGWLSAKADASLPPLPPLSTKMLHFALLLALSICATALSPEVVEHILTIATSAP